VKRLVAFLIAFSFVSLTNAEVKITIPTCPGMQVSTLNAISNKGVMVGSYFTDSDPTFHPLLITKKGKCLPIGQGTILATTFAIAFGINDRGDISGTYYEGGAFTPPTHGFLLDKTGSLTLLDFPTADNTIGYGINESGTMVGIWSVNDSSGNLLFQHGFVWNNGAFTDVDPGYPLTFLAGINARGDAVGNGTTPDFTQGYPFLYRSGEVIPILESPPASRSGFSPSGINNKGDIVGQYFDQNGTLHGFLKVGSIFTTIDHPNGMWNTVQGINNSGKMVGGYWDSNWALHAFMAEIQ
jgi:uncharacterized membrane protein